MAHYCHYHGWPVLPLQPRSKVPLAKLLPGGSWNQLARTPATVKQIDEWFSRCPEANLGLITGQASGIIVVDLDQKAQDLYLPPTVVVRTSRGWHFWYRHTSPLRSRSSFEWGELKADGGMVVIPPSIHPDGTQYEFALPGDDPAAHLVEAPGWLTALSFTRASKTILSCSSTSEAILSRSSASVGAAEGEAGEWPFKQLAREEEVAFRILRLCGVEVEALGKPFRCPLPGHDEQRPSAALWRPRDDPEGIIGFHDFHLRDDAEWIPLPDVFAAVTTGEFRRLRGGERAVWWLRALVEAGFIALPPLEARELPPEAPEAARKLYRGFVYLLRVRELWEPGQGGAPFSWRFAGRWCGISSQGKVSEGMKYLLKSGYVRILKPGNVVGESGRRRATILALGSPG